MAIIKVAGLDGSFRHFGIVTAFYNTGTQSIIIDKMTLLEPKGQGKLKVVRASSDNFRCAGELAEGLFAATEGCAVVFSEIPSGGQDYNAVLGFGIVIGLCGMLSTFMPMTEVSPAETKKAAVGTAQASKEEMIDWAMRKHPEAGWLTRKLKGKIVPIAKNEHLADACAVIEAGIRTPSFRQTAAIMQAADRQAA